MYHTIGRFIFNLNFMNDSIEIRDLRDGDWVWVNKIVLFSEHISSTDFKVYSGLASYAGNQTQKSWPGLGNFSKKLFISKNTLIKSLKQLEKLALISIRHRIGRSNIYSLLKVNENLKPKETKRKQSDYDRFIQFFIEISRKTRGITPAIEPKDYKNLKRIFDTKILSVEELEQKALYFLAHENYKEFNPRISTFLSNGIIKSIIRRERGENYWAELYEFENRYLKIDKIFEEKKKLLDKLNM